MILLFSIPCQSISYQIWQSRKQHSWMNWIFTISILTENYNKSNEAALVCIKSCDLIQKFLWSRWSCIKFYIQISNLMYTIEQLLRRKKNSLRFLYVVFVSLNAFLKSFLLFYWIIFTLFFMMNQTSKFFLN